MNIAILGTRGIPANYGGFETFAEQLAVRLVRRGHRVTVYSRSHYSDTRRIGNYLGVRIVVLPTIKHKYFDTVFHTFISTLHCLFQDYQAVLICNAANACFSFIPRLRGQKVIVNVDGLERQRKKWNRIGRSVYAISERLVTFLPDAIVSDSLFIQSYYQTRYRKSSVYIAYGGDLPEPSGKQALRKYQLTPDRYVLFVGRLEPEYNAHRVLKAFRGLKTDMKMVFVGDAPYGRKYIAGMKSLRDERVSFLGSIYGEDYRQILANSYFCVRASEVGGTHPALLEAMGYGKCVLVSDNRQNRETVGEAGMLFRLEENDDLRDKMRCLIDRPDLVRDYGIKARQRVDRHYTWERVTLEYEKLFRNLAGRPGCSR